MERLAAHDLERLKRSAAMRSRGQTMRVQGAELHALLDELLELRQLVTRLGADMTTVAKIARGQGSLVPPEAPGIDCSVGGPQRRSLSLPGAFQPIYDDAEGLQEPPNACWLLKDRTEIVDINGSPVWSTHPSCGTQLQKHRRGGRQAPVRHRV